MMNRLLLPMLILGVGCAADPETEQTADPQDETDDPALADPDDPNCAYPEGAVEPMALGEVLSAYSWPEARHMGTGQQAALDLAHVPCNSDPAIDWSDYDALLFVSVPAWCGTCVAHTGSVNNVSEQIEAAGAGIIWVLEQTQSYQDGTAELCETTMGNLGVERGWCVGDGQSAPQPGAFDDSPFSVNRGFDMIVPRSTMVIEFESSHGSPSGNDNLSGEELLEKVEEILAQVRGE